MNYFIFAFFILIVFIAADCRDDRMIERDTAAKIYVELSIVEELYKARPDSLASKRDFVFNKYSTAPSDYEFTLEAYYDDRDEWDAFFRESNSYLDSLTNSGLPPSL